MKYFSILIFTSLFFGGCNSYKTSLISYGNYEDAIQNTIIDFSNTSLFEKGKVFKLHFESLNNDLYHIMIIESFDNKYLYSKEKKIEENKLPSRCFELNNKLFIWWDDNYTIDKEVFSKLEKYSMLEDDKGGWITFLESSIDDKKKGVDYFICKNNLKIYKRIITRIGNIPIPVLECNK
ncbi:hypothetical protein ABH942_002477 [Flavobacterium sp. 28YEA47A]|uniref:hypothetical protein n=1 Tax=Flavobacterium sp. 28YEA47A TaxID=3156276 RepID=UPI003518B0D6